MHQPFIISVGNIAMGGTGKTPFTIYLAKFFLSAGLPVAILSLGYRGAIGYGINEVSDGKRLFIEPPMAADEPYMMAKELLNYNGIGAIVITGKERNDSYKLAVQKYNPSIFILDDGFQHKRMQRDLDIVLLDYHNPISTGFPVPFGYLREFPSGLKRADIVIFTRAESTVIPEKASKYCKDKKVFFADYSLSKVMINGRESDINILAGKRVWLMSGIAKPKQFENAVLASGAVVEGHTKFKDHHAYSDKDIQTVIIKGADSEYIVTTEKDFVKIPATYHKHFCYTTLSVNLLNMGFDKVLNDIVKLFQK